ncbi:sensor histidine kinase [Streptomyces sp. NPDC020802]|uniref:sensor histidine kinase n=1 Tax=Streptomyces sp. NPDC020802 TaxID=3365094 RepID=UPI0037AC7EDF
MSDVNLARPTDYPTTPRSRRQSCLRAVGVTVLVLLTFADLLIAASGNSAVWPLFVVLPLGLAALLWPVDRRPRWLTPQVRTGVPAGVSLALTAVAAPSGRMDGFGPGEIAILLCLLLVAVRDCPPRWAAMCAVLDGTAVVVQPLRMVRDALDRDDTASLFGATLVLLLLVGIMAGLGGYLRTLDHRREVAVTEIRRSERLAMAADLHDFVAHHVTGILVQTQVARMMVATEPENLDPVLAGIQNAATEALASMRRTVGILREAPHPAVGPESGGPAGGGPDGGGPANTGPEAAGLHPSGDLAALAELVERFGGPAGPRALLDRDPSVPDGLPHEVQAAAHRVVQEALTNVRRHAADATEVTVRLTYAEGTLRVLVRDDGRGGTQMPHAARGGGFGIVGLTERVTALGGALRTGPRPDTGWEVTALLPAAGTRGKRPTP